MEYCMEAKAFKSSLLSETVLKSTTQQVVVDDMWCFNGVNNVRNSDDFSVDDLLDFSNKDLEPCFEEKEYLSHDKGIDDDKSFNFTSPSSGDFDSLPVPVDEMEHLEWLSQFIDDSVSSMPSWLPGNPREKVRNFDVIRSEPATKKFTVLDLPKPVCTKARSKRSRRPNGYIWSLGLILLTESLSSSLYSSHSQDSSLTSAVMNFEVVENTGSFQKPPSQKRQKKNPICESELVSSGSNSLRTCTHCLVQKTPQWRTGPLGPKTLCNACGVRFKLGRLFPEYRPACSPTFAGHIHSNSHRKVLEMRRKKEAEEYVMPGLTLQRELYESRNVVMQSSGKMDLAGDGKAATAGSVVDADTGRKQNGKAKQNKVGALYLEAEDQLMAAEKQKVLDKDGSP
ncbi:GATA transcription factor [Heracleum sosnowskyi]|uniref:GATA transcription factor n=1 Tax=Heracleum sosnowskyi TaxID=360622 RepID=A0AAD8J0B6_9APIA|nr:GATA transcription factor [Heracleum sosnowskyi]